MSDEGMSPVAQRADSRRAVHPVFGGTLAVRESHLSITKHTYIVKRVFYT